VLHIVCRDRPEAVIPSACQRTVKFVIRDEN
jgi:hypothetical protein